MKEVRYYRGRAYTKKVPKPGTPMDGCDVLLLITFAQK